MTADAQYGRKSQKNYPIKHAPYRLFTSFKGWFKLMSQDAFRIPYSIH